MQELIYLFSLPREWLIERQDIIYKVLKDMPEGEIECKQWVERQEWDTPTVQERIVSYFKNTAKKY